MLGTMHAQPDHRVRDQHTDQPAHQEGGQHWSDQRMPRSRRAGGLHVLTVAYCAMLRRSKASHKRIRDASARASARRGSVRTTRRCSQMANAGSCRDPLDDCRGSAAGPCPAELTLRRQGAPGARTPPARVTVTVAQGPPRLRRWRASRTPTLRCRRRLPVPGPSSNPGHPISAANQPWRVPAGEGWLRGGCTPGFAARTSPSDSRRASEPQPWNGCLSIRGRPEARRSPGLGCHPVHALPLPPRDPGHGMRQRPHTPMCGRLVSDLSAMSGRASGEAPGNAALGAGHL